MTKADDTIAALRKELNESTATSAAELMALKAERDALKSDIERATTALNDTIAAHEAEMTGLRQLNSNLSARLADCVAKLNKANDPVHGIEPPRKIDDIPSLDKLPAHKPLPTTSTDEEGRPLDHV
jgi:chromosome segregation ATPase